MRASSFEKLKKTDKSNKIVDGVLNLTHIPSPVQSTDGVHDVPDVDQALYALER